MVSQQLVNIKPYTHHTTVDSTHLRCKAMRYENPVVAIQQCQAKDEIREHFRSVYNDKGNNRQPCEACGTQTTWRCGLCEKAMCTTTNRVWTGNKCILAYHSHNFFGLSRSDRVQLEGKDVRTWTPPSNIAVSKNAWKIKRWKKEIANNTINGDKDK